MTLGGALNNVPADSTNKGMLAKVRADSNNGGALAKVRVCVSMYLCICVSVCLFVCVCVYGTGVFVKVCSDSSNGGRWIRYVWVWVWVCGLTDYVALYCADSNGVHADVCDATHSCV